VCLLATAHVRAVPADATLRAGLERGSYAGAAAQAEEAVRPLLLDEGLETLVLAPPSAMILITVVI
jgi:hypothetical protein